MSDPLGAAVVGTGFGVLTHVRALDAAGIEVRALVGRDPDKTAKRAERFGIEHATTDRREAFARDDVDVVAVTTPPAHPRRGRARRGRGRQARGLREAVRARSCRGPRDAARGRSRGGRPPARHRVPVRARPGPADPRRPIRCDRRSPLHAVRAPAADADRPRGGDARVVGRCGRRRRLARRVRDARHRPGAHDARRDHPGVGDAHDVVAAAR